MIGMLIGNSVYQERKFWLQTNFKMEKATRGTSHNLKKGTEQ